VNDFTVMDVEGGVPVFLWNRGVSIQEEAIQQLRNLARMPFVYKHVAAMPDTHWGMGATVGSVFASEGAVIPAAVGVDIGCGMIAARINFGDAARLPASNRAAIRAEIEGRIPMGRTNNGGKGDRGAWKKVPEDIAQIWKAQLAEEFASIVAANPTIGRGNTENHLGTLGTGNHFIEIQFDELGRMWIMLHSGSRGVGNRIGAYFIRKAKELAERSLISLPDKDLAYLPQADPLYAQYIKALHWAQKFAFVNRQIMLQRTLEALRAVIPGVRILEEINTHHNYAEFENHFGKDILLTRKGAIKAHAGDLGIIPGSMGTRSYIVRGLGNKFSFHSCSHGAGRAMSRTEARKRFTVEDHAKATEGVECRKDADVIDETPMAYKDIDQVIEAERDLVEVVHTLKQIISCKG
jgi:tRNA-splicing ligase RtcB (3'-phosphate/5'-hydroxy nucleic acid ligase)